MFGLRVTVVIVWAFALQFPELLGQGQTDGLREQPCCPTNWMAQVDPAVKAFGAPGGPTTGGPLDNYNRRRLWYKVLDSPVAICKGSLRYKCDTGLCKCNDAANFAFAEEGTNNCTGRGVAGSFCSFEENIACADGFFCDNMPLMPGFQHCQAGSGPTTTTGGPGGEGGASEGHINLPFTLTNVLVFGGIAALGGFEFFNLLN